MHSRIPRHQIENTIPTSRRHHERHLIRNHAAVPAQLDDFP